MNWKFWERGQQKVSCQHEWSGWTVVQAYVLTYAFQDPKHIIIQSRVCKMCKFLETQKEVVQ